MKILHLLKTFAKDNLNNVFESHKLYGHEYSGARGENALFG